MTARKKSAAAKKADMERRELMVEGRGGGELKGYHETGRALTSGEELVFRGADEVGAPRGRKGKQPEVYNDLGEVWGYTDDGQLVTVREDRGLVARPRRPRGRKSASARSKDRSRAHGGAHTAPARRATAGKTGRRASKR